MSTRPIAVSLSVVLIVAGYSVALFAESSDERLRTVEDRLARVEAILDRLLERLPDQAEEVATLERETGALRREIGHLNGAEPVPAEPIPAQRTPQITGVLSGPDQVSDDPVSQPPSGYMEMHLNNEGLNPTTLDFHRFVLMFGHSFGSRIRFWSELELEHAFVEGAETSGELELEQAYLDFLIHPKFNFRTGMLLAPVGIINERHEPPSFNGVERPFVDSVIVPSTWFGSGGGFVGDLGKGFSYKAYVMSTLNAAEFSADEGFRGGRQKGFLENARNMATTARLEYRGIPRLTLGTSFWTGRTGFDLRDIPAQARVFEFDGRYRVGRLDLRGQFAVTDLNDAAEINRARQQTSGVNPNLAETMRGFYLEEGFHVLPEQFRHDLVAFYRYENFDTQYRMPQGFLPLSQFDRTAHVLGLTYYPYPDIALKVDYNVMGNASSVVRSRNRWNFGVGWWF